MHVLLYVGASLTATVAGFMMAEYPTVKEFISAELYGTPQPFTLGEVKDAWFHIKLLWGATAVLGLGGLIVQGRKNNAKAGD